MNEEIIMYLGDLLSTEQLHTLNKWKLEQQKQYMPGQSGAIGGEYTYSFTPTSLGTIIKVHNEMTKQELDLTEYSDF